MDRPGHGSDYSLAAMLGASEALRAFGDRLADFFRSFWHLLTHDTTGMSERAVLVPYLLAAWLLAGLLVSPASLLVLRILGERKDIRRVVAVNFGILVTQLALFGLNWGVIGWGDRDVDQGVFAISLVPATIIALWGLDVSLPKALVHAFGLAILGLAAVFLGAFAATELGLMTL